MRVKGTTGDSANPLRLEGLEATIVAGRSSAAQEKQSSIDLKFRDYAWLNHGGGSAGESEPENM